MRIIWDEPKQLANLDKHCLDFADLTLEFFAAAFVLPVRERRHAAIGLLQGEALTVIHLRLGTEAISVISMRRASVGERRLLNEH